MLIASISSMVGAFTLLLAMLIPQYPLPNMTSSAAELLYHLFLAFTMSTFIYITFLEIINQTLLWLVPLQSNALANALYLGLHQVEISFEKDLIKKKPSLPPHSLIMDTFCHCNWTFCYHACRKMPTASFHF